MQRLALSVVGALVAGTFAVTGGTIRAATPAASFESAAQTPRPFPRPPAQPSEPSTAPAPTTPPPQAPSAPAPQSQTPQPPPTARPAQPGTPAADQAPTEAELGVPIYPNAQFIGSYDAGKGQRFYLFGVAASFSDMVNYYRTTLKTRGEQLFETPGTHLFEIGRFRDETMAFPPSVTVKDYTWGGSPGLANPKPGAEPSHFPTVIQIVPAPAAR